MLSLCTPAVWLQKGTVEEIFENPSHPYTIGLMASKPVVGKKVDKLYSIPGKVPNPINMPDYCYFKDRCEMCLDCCSGKYPNEVSLSPTHKVSCYRYYEEILERCLWTLLQVRTSRERRRNNGAGKDREEIGL